MGSLRGVLSHIRYMIEIDTRTLAMFRIALGLLIIGDLIARSTKFTYFYTEDGVVPQALAEARTAENAFSFFFFTTDTNVIAALFLLHGFFAVLLIIGYLTRLAIIVSFLFVISLDHHNPLVLSHADSLFRMLMFWAMFLPLGERWSIDAIHRERPARVRIANLASAAVLFQMIYMYVVNGSLKTQSTAWLQGTATPLVFGLDDMTWFLATYLRNYPTLLEYGGWLWFIMLLASPLLLILPGRPRTLLTMMFLVAHASFAVTVRIGAYAYVAIAGGRLFLPALFWRDVTAASRRLGFIASWGRSIGSGIERFGHRLASVLPVFRLNFAFPKPLASAFYNVLLIGAIVAVFVVPSAVHLFLYEVVEREPTRAEQRIYRGTQVIGATQPRWSVFAPNPRSQDRYYVFAAMTTDGELLDVYNDRPLTFDRPYEELHHQYDNYRERFYMNSIWRGGQHGEPGRLLAEYLCGTYPEQHGVELTDINMYLVIEYVTLETIATPEDRERERTLIARHACGDHEPMDIEVPEL
jgi:hypothetical protein